MALVEALLDSLRAVKWQPLHLLPANRHSAPLAFSLSGPQNPTPYSLQPAVFRLQPRPFTLHPEPLHLLPATRHSALVIRATLHPTCTPHPTPCIPLSTPCTVPCTIHSLQPVEWQPLHLLPPTRHSAPLSNPYVHPPPSTLHPSAGHAARTHRIPHTTPYDLHLTPTPNRQKLAPYSLHLTA